MKKFIILVLIIPIFLMVGCLDNYIPIEEYNNEIALYESQLEEAKSKTEAKSIEILELKEEINTLENDLELSNEETEKYKYLLNNLNDLLSNVYYGWASNNRWESGNFTAFSIEYNGKYYLITAGHCVHYKDDKIDTGLYTYFKFKANFTNEWIYPKLLAYENDYLNNNDYAIFYSDKIDNGFKIDNDNDKGIYILGNNNVNINIIKSISPKINNIEGESGSSIIDFNGEVTGISTTGLPYSYYTPIKLVIEAIDNLE